MPHNWPSRNQSEIVLGITEVEYIVLSTAAKEVLPLRETITDLKFILNYLDTYLVIIYILFEDNKGAEDLSNIPKNRPRIKHIAEKYHHIREAVCTKTLLIKRVDMKCQLMSIFHKTTYKTTIRTYQKEHSGLDSNVVTWKYGC